MKTRSSRKMLRSVRNALARLIAVNEKNSVSPILGDTSPEAMGKSFFRLFALSYSWSKY